jgi:nitrate reductase cytochrome c-type subunit
MECHFEGLEMSEGHVAKKIPTSHYRNDYAEEQKEGVTVGIWYNCLQCHVPQATAEPGYAR